MTTLTEPTAADLGSHRRERAIAVITRLSRWLGLIGLGWIGPLLRLLMRDNPREQLAALRDGLIVPLAGIGLFLFAWGALAPQVQTSLGAIPGPAQVWEQATGLWADDQGVVRHDELVSFEVMTDNLDRDWWRDYREQLGQRFRQEQIVMRASSFDLL